MRKDQRLSRALHMLIHMQAMQAPVSSDHLAHMIDTNPVVVRRLFQGLKTAGIVDSLKGTKGGWVLKKSLNTITLLTVLEAIDTSDLFSLGWETDSEHCQIEKAVNHEIKDTLEAAESLIKNRFAQITLDKLAPAELSSL